MDVFLVRVETKNGLKFAWPVPGQTGGYARVAGAALIEGLLPYGDSVVSSSAEPLTVAFAIAADRKNGRI